MSEQAGWEQARQREYAAGENRPHLANGTRHPSSVKLLRDHERRHARLDVLCRNRLIARVVADPIRACLTVATEAKQPASADSGYAFDMYILNTDDIIKVNCRCGRREHVLDPRLLTGEADRQRAGKVKTVGVAVVSQVP